MNERQKQAVLNAAASSAMEGMPLEERHFQIIEQIYKGEITLQEYLVSLSNKNKAG